MTTNKRRSSSDRVRYYVVNRLTSTSDTLGRILSEHRFLRRAVEAADRLEGLRVVIVVSESEQRGDIYLNSGDWKQIDSVEIEWARSDTRAGVVDQPQRPDRYRVRETLAGCTVWLSAAYDPSGETTTHSFFIAHEGGYVFEELEGRPGTSGRQVCDSLFGNGDTLYLSSRTAIVRALRWLAKRHCDSIDRESCLHV